MDINSLLLELEKRYKKIQILTLLVREIKKLNTNPIENLSKIISKTDKLEKESQKLEDAYIVGIIGEFLEKYRKEVQSFEDKIRNEFGLELSKELENVGLKLTGQFPEFKAGLFTIEVNLQSRAAKVWYGPKQEFLFTCKLSPKEIVKRIEKTRKELGVKEDIQVLINKLHIAYEDVIKSAENKDAPICKVLNRLAFLLQDEKFLYDPRKENYRGYSRADFSYDLYRIRNYKDINMFKLKVHLKVAPIAYTKKRSDFLWIPDDEYGSGTNYSHLRLEEAKNE